MNTGQGTLNPEDAYQYKMDTTVVPEMRESQEVKEGSPENLEAPPTKQLS